MRAGHDGWLRGDPAAAAALDACRWDRRGWEHDFLATLLDGDTAALESAVWAEIRPSRPVTYGRPCGDGTVRLRHVS